ncbi:carbon storage regulator [Pseudomonas sp. 15FMM2]|uniref:Carbon storage regulator n=1 Tax=Pseudomonas imrae TaxID=2992837 RepID=A0ACC7PBI7_9PSED
MLVLSRAVGEIIAIGDHITLKVLEVNSTQVKLGVQARSGIKVYRAEVYQRAPATTAPVPNP